MQHLDWELGNTGCTRAARKTRIVTELPFLLSRTLLLVALELPEKQGL